jgi:hypothetical protein
VKGHSVRRDNASQLCPPTPRVPASIRKLGAIWGSESLKHRNLTPSGGIYACARTIECFTQNARRCKIRNLIKATGILYLICVQRLSDQKLCISSVETTPGRLTYPEISRGPPELDRHSVSHLLAYAYGLRSSITLSKSGFHKNC